MWFVPFDFVVLYWLQSSYRHRSQSAWRWAIVAFQKDYSHNTDRIAIESDDGELIVFVYLHHHLTNQRFQIDDRVKYTYKEKLFHSQGNDGKQKETSVMKWRFMMAHEVIDNLRKDGNR